MRGDLRLVVRAGVAATLALLLVVAFLPGRLEPAVRVYVLVLCTGALVLALSALRRALPPTTDHRISNARMRPRQIARLKQLENEVALGMASSFDLHHRLRPRLRGLAAGLLASRRGMSLDAEPEAARLALGDKTWDVVRRDRPPPEDRRAAGLAPGALAEIVDSLERL